MKRLLMYVIIVATSMVQAAEDGAAAIGTYPAVITINASDSYYTLPRHVWGMKFVGYEHGRVNDDKTKSSDGKTYSQLILELKMDWLKAAYYNRFGTVEEPHVVVKNWKKLADQIVDAGGVYFPEIHILPKGFPGSKLPPEDVTNIDDVKGGGNPENIIAWLDYLAAEKGVDKLRGYEPYNEPCTRVNSQTRDFWYSDKDFQGVDRLAADWATVHHRQVSEPLMKKYPNMAVCGSAFSSPASSYGIRELTRFIEGYETWPWKDNNTKYMTALSIHSYGYRAGENGGLPSAPDYGQSTINSYFYPEYVDPGRKSGYKAAVDEVRKILAKNGGENVKIANSEWWAIDSKELTPVPASRSALGDIIGAVVHCQNADVWKFDSISIHAANPAPITDDLARWIGPQDCMVGIANGQLYRPVRYYANKDMSGKFLNNYKKLVRLATDSPKGARGMGNNAIQSIQACAGINETNGTMGVLVINTNANKAAELTLDFGSAVYGKVMATILPAGHPIDTPLPTKQIDVVGNKISLNLDPAGAALLEVSVKK